MKDQRPLVIVQSLSGIWLSASLRTAACQAPLSFTICQSLLKFMSIESNHLTLSHHLVLCSSLLLCPQSCPPSGSFPMSRLFTSGGSSIRASASAPVLPMNIQNWFPLWLTGLISLQSKRLSRISSAITVQTSILPCSALFMVQLSHPYITIGKNKCLTWVWADF